MYQKFTQIFIIIILAFSFIIGQTKKDEIIVAKFKGQKISLEEFETAYAKNVGGIDKAKKDSTKNYINFLDLYLKYKMKLVEAKEKGFDNNPEILEELNQYKEQIASGYLIEKNLIEPETKKLYEKTKTGEPLEIIMCILSNYTPDCLVRAEVSCDVKELSSITEGMKPEIFAARFERAVRIAHLDPYRATTHNKCYGLLIMLIML